MTPEQRQEHIDRVRELSKHGGPLDRDSVNATVNNPAWFRENGTPRRGRREVHSSIIAQMLVTRGDPVQAILHQC